MATFAAVPAGWPAGNFGPVRRRPVADVIHRDRWQESGSASTRADSPVG
ncbi:hypothetical protein ACIQRK_18960 [Streptomyces anulatus]